MKFMKPNLAAYSRKQLGRHLALILVTAMTLGALPAQAKTPVATPTKSAKKTTTTTPKKGTMTATVLPSVSTAIGSAPTISAPAGAPPTTLTIKDVVIGKGAAALSSSTVTAHYVLMSWKSGKVLESSWSGGSAPTFPLSNVIPGWQQGIPGMKIGGRRLLVIPPQLAYGPNGVGPIGPNETLIFVVDLQAVK